MRLPLAVLAFIAATATSSAQTAQGNVSSQAQGGNSTIRQLLDLGYEIKSSVPNGSRFIVFMQKDQTAYACEFVTVTNSRCESLN